MIKLLTNHGSYRTTICLLCTCNLWLKYLPNAIRCHIQRDPANVLFVIQDWNRKALCKHTLIHFIYIKATRKRKTFQLKKWFNKSKSTWENLWWNSGFLRISRIPDIFLTRMRRLSVLKGCAVGKSISFSLMIARFTSFCVIFVDLQAKNTWTDETKRLLIELFGCSRFIVDTDIEIET